MNNSLRFLIAVLLMGCSYGCLFAITILSFVSKQVLLGFLGIISIIAFTIILKLKEKEVKNGRNKLEK